ncbi:MAG: hypothetical protein EA412_02370, partial [Chitinophagaceae bacterium]
MRKFIKYMQYCFLVVSITLLPKSNLNAQTEWNYYDGTWLINNWSVLKFTDENSKPETFLLKDSILPSQIDNQLYYTLGHAPPTLNNKEGDLELILLNGGGNLTAKHLVDHHFQLIEHDTFTVILNDTFNLTNWIGSIQYPFFLKINPDKYMLITAGWNPDIIWLPEDNPYLCKNTVHDVSHIVNSPNCAFWYYHIVERKNNGEFVVSKQNQLFLKDYRMGCRLGAARHANGRDWWLLMHTTRCDDICGDKIYRFLIQDGKIKEPDILQGANQLCGVRDDAGKILFTHDAEKVIFSSVSGQIDVYDFKRCTGDLDFSVSLGYNPTFQLTSPNDDSLKLHGIYGRTITENNRYLYVNNTAIYTHSQFNPYCDSLVIYRYDLQEPGKREVLIRKKACDTLAFGQIQTGPDGNIYMSPFRYNFGVLQPTNSYWDSTLAYMSAITNPEAADISDVTFDKQYIYLGDSAKTFGTLPFFANHLSALPIYQAESLQDTIFACEGDTIQLGKDPIDNIIYEWQELNALQGRYEANPKIPVYNSGYFTVRLEETGSKRFSCTER